MLLFPTISVSKSELFVIIVVCGIVVTILVSGIVIMVVSGIVSMVDCVMLLI